MKDKNKVYGVMKKPSLEQQICRDKVITFVVRKIGAVGLALVGLMVGSQVGRQAGKIWADLEIFKILYSMKHSTFHCV